MQTAGSMEIKAGEAKISIQIPGGLCSPAIRVIIVTGANRSAWVGHFPDVAQVVAGVEVVGGSDLNSFGVKAFGDCCPGPIALLAHFQAAPHKALVASYCLAVLFDDSHAPSKT